MLVIEIKLISNEECAIQAIASKNSAIKMCSNRLTYRQSFKYLKKVITIQKKHNFNKRLNFKELKLIFQTI